MPVPDWVTARMPTPSLMEPVDWKTEPALLNVSVCAPAAPEPILPVRLVVPPAACETVNPWFRVIPPEKVELLGVAPPMV